MAWSLKFLSNLKGQKSGLRRPTAREVEVWLKYLAAILTASANAWPKNRGAAEDYNSDTSKPSPSEHDKKSFKKD